MPMPPAVNGSLRPAVARLIRDKRLALGLTQEQFAHRLGVSVMTVSRWERGAMPSRPHRHLLAKKVGGRPADYIEA